MARHCHNLPTPHPSHKGEGDAAAPPPHKLTPMPPTPPHTRATRGWGEEASPCQDRSKQMASIRKEILTKAWPDDVWDALRDIGALHTRLVPGFVTETRLE